ncbi:E3 ubiquitin-protein ligase [Acorus calamus]|uniref:RING-type E3 ubiquitin transferase n=1 Tax=Acorus calamus TaxID=4465 RepID=A0AAV9DXS6_ACOCL|nr:E3 ubiquitin-protein ligase [Acorus calamus]
MESQTNPTPADETTIDPTPLLPPGEAARRQPARRTVVDAGRASIRRMMREPSMLVRETAAEQLEERQGDWAYSGPVVILDLLWNLAFVAVSIAVLILSRDEEPSIPLRLWIIGYGFQCLLHMVCVCIEYRRRHPQQWLGLEDDEGSGRRGRSGMEEDITDGGSGYDGEQAREVDEKRTS